MKGAQNENENSENGSRALDAIKWIQIAFTLVEKTDDEAALGTNELKVQGIFRVPHGTLSPLSRFPECHPS